jgi:hypothetical protein
MAYPGTNDVLRRFSRDTEWVAAGLLGAVFFAALALAVLLPERHPNAADLTKEASQAKPGSSLSADAATHFRIVDLNAKRSTSEVTSETAPHVDQGFTEISSKESLAQMEATTGSTPPLVLVFSPGISRAIARTNASRSSPAHEQDSVRVRLNIPKEKYRSSGRFRAVDVKMRLIALWRQSLRRSEKPSCDLAKNRRQ